MPLTRSAERRRHRRCAGGRADTTAPERRRGREGGRPAGRGVRCRARSDPPRARERIPYQFYLWGPRALRRAPRAAFERRERRAGSSAVLGAARISHYSFNIIYVTARNDVTTQQTRNDRTFAHDAYRVHTRAAALVCAHTHAHHSSTYTSHDSRPHSHMPMTDQGRTARAGG